MDCQTESFADVELLKDKKHFECDHCAENLPAGSKGYVEEPLPVPTNGNIELYTGDVDEPFSPNYGSELEEDDNVLDITALPSAPEPDGPLGIDEVIALPLYDLEVNSSESHRQEEAILDDAPQVLEPAFSAPVRKLPASAAAETYAREAAPVNQHQLFEEPATSLPVVPKGTKLLSVPVTILTGITFAFVLYVSLGNMSTPPKGEVSAQAVAPARPVSPKVSEVKQAAAPVPVESPEAVKPAPTPAPPAVESKPAAPVATVTQPAAPQPSTAEAGKFTVQVGSHNDMKQANDQADKLRGAGFEVRVVGVDIPKRGRWYRIQTGSFGTREEANRHGAQVLGKGVAETFVIAAQ
jgi:cell division protein FtsN